MSTLTPPVKPPDEKQQAVPPELGTTAKCDHHAAGNVRAYVRVMVNPQTDSFFDLCAHCYHDNEVLIALHEWSVVGDAREQLAVSS